MKIDVSNTLWMLTGFHKKMRLKNNSYIHKGHNGTALFSIHVLTFPGNDVLHALTTQGQYRLHVDLQDWGTDEHYYAQYDSFRVGPAATRPNPSLPRPFPVPSPIRPNTPR